MLKSNVLLQHIENFLEQKLTTFYAKRYKITKEPTEYLKRVRATSSAHEYIKALLVGIAERNKLFPIPEYYVSEDRKRIDMVFMDYSSEKMVYAFEIDRVVNKNSVDKLIQCDCEKIIISVGDHQKQYAHRKLRGTGIMQMDLTKKTLLRSVTTFRTP